jgi:ABC-2 type transport system permease protein
VRLYLHELQTQQRLFWRTRELAFFTFLLPILFLLLLGSVYGDEQIEGVKGSSYLLAGMLGYGVAATTFAGLSISLVVDREQGILKRLRATPLPARTLISALISSHLVAYALEAAVLVVLARVVFGAPLPRRVFSLVLLVVLGALAFAALGLAVTTFVRSAQGSSAVVNAIYLPMAFISGSFFSVDSFPRFIEVIAQVLPLTYFIELARDVIIHDRAIWDRPGAVAVVAAWGILGALVAMRHFRWEPREG